MVAYHIESHPFGIVAYNETLLECQYFFILHSDACTVNKRENRSLFFVLFCPILKSISCLLLAIVVRYAISLNPYPILIFAVCQMSRLHPFETISKSFKICETVVRVSNSLDPDELLIRIKAV